MAGLTDWIDIFERHAASNGTVTLSPSEVVRLRYDMAKAQKALADGVVLLKKQQEQLAQAISLAERFSERCERAVALANKFAAFSGSEV